MTTAVQVTLAALGQTINTARLSRNMTQEAVKDIAGIGMNTMIKIEKGSPTVQMGHYASVLDALGIIGLLKNAADISKDEIAVESMRGLLPKRATTKRRKPY